MQINYAALAAPATAQDVKNYKTAMNGRFSAVEPFLFGILIFIAGLGLLTSIVFTATLQDEGSIVFLVVMLLLAGATAWGLWAAKQRDKKYARLYRFAQANSATLSIGIPNTTHRGFIFNVGHSRRIISTLQFQDGVEVGNYQYVVGSGKHSRTYLWGYASSRLSRHVPNMVLDAKKNNAFGRFSNLPSAFQKDQILHLEGNFDDYYTLYAPKAYERDAFYLFTPDVMEALIAAGGSFDIEVVDDHIYLYSVAGLKIDDAERLQQVMHIMERINTELEHQADYYADERIGDRSVDAVAAPGRRLKQRWGWGAIVIATLALFYAIFSFISSIAKSLM